MKNFSRSFPNIKRLVIISLMSVSSFITAAPYEPSNLPLMDISQLEYVGGFRLPGGNYGESSFGYSEGKITLGAGGNSMFVVGHAHQQAIAEVSIPAIVNTTNVANMNYATIMQDFSRVLNRTETGNSQQQDRISGMEYYNGRLLVNTYEYYDGAGDAAHTTLVVNNAASLAGSSVAGFYGFDQKAVASGWITPLTPSWQTLLGGTHITGGSSGKPIVTRLSSGPAAFAFNIQSDMLNAPSGSTVSTTLLSSYGINHPVGDVNGLGSEYMMNNDRANKMWTHRSHAVYGFVVPGTRTYATFGATGGHESGVGYKVVQAGGSGTECPGYCSRDRYDVQNYYWLFDLNDLMQVKAGLKNAEDVVPYAYGDFAVPNQPGGFSPPEEGIMGGTFDASTNTLYFSVYGIDSLQNPYETYPVIVAYKLAGEPVPVHSPSMPPSNVNVE